MPTYAYYAGYKTAAIRRGHLRHLEPFAANPVLTRPALALLRRIPSHLPATSAALTEGSTHEIMYVVVDKPPHTGTHRLAPTTVLA